MKHSDQQNTTQSIVSYNCNKVVDGRNKWSGCYRRVDIDLLEEQRNQCTHRTRYFLCHHQRLTDTAGYRILRLLHLPEGCIRPEKTGRACSGRTKKNYGKKWHPAKG